MSNQEPTSVTDKVLLSKLVVGIGEVSAVTQIPQRQIRYWEEKGIIQSVPDEKSASTRKYSYATIKRMILIKEMLDEGFTLTAAVKKVDARYERLEKAFDQLA